MDNLRVYSCIRLVQSVLNNRYRPSFHLACLFLIKRKKREMSGLREAWFVEAKEKWLHENWGGLTLRLESDQTCNVGWFCCRLLLCTARNERCCGPEIFGWAVYFRKGKPMEGWWEDIGKKLCVSCLVFSIRPEKFTYVQKYRKVKTSLKAPG